MSMEIFLLPGSRFCGIFSAGMNEITGAEINSSITMDVLKSSLDQSTKLAEELIKMNTENVIDINQLEYMGTVVDLYA